MHFNLYHTSLCFVNTHLSAHMEEVEKRNQVTMDIHSRQTTVDLSFDHLSLRVRVQEFVEVMNNMSFITHDYKYDVAHHE